MKVIKVLDDEVKYEKEVNDFCLTNSTFATHESVFVHGGHIVLFAFIFYNQQ